MLRWVVGSAAGVTTGLWYALTAYRSSCGAPPPLFSSRSRSADYTDRYCAPLHESLTIDQIAEAALQQGREVDRSPTEIVFEDDAPGLRFTVSYELAPDERSIVFATAVHPLNRTGRWYFFVIRPFHRLLAPVVPIATARRAANVPSVA